MMKRWSNAIGLSLAAVLLGGCSLSKLVGGGGEPPPTLLTLTAEAASPGAFTRSAAAGEAVTIAVPTVAKELRTVRVPVRVSVNEIAYVKDLQWVDTPNRIFRELLSETLVRTTGRVVLDSGQTTLDPGLTVSGDLQRFDFDAATGDVVAIYDATLSTAGGTRVETRRFEARETADGTALTVGPALNRAANRIAADFAAWIAR